MPFPLCAMESLVPKVPTRLYRRSRNDKTYDPSVYTHIYVPDNREHLE